MHVVDRLLLTARAASAMLAPDWLLLAFCQARMEMAAAATLRTGQLIACFASSWCCRGLVTLPQGWRALASFLLMSFLPCHVELCFICYINHSTINRSFHAFFINWNDGRNKEVKTFWYLLYKINVYICKNAPCCQERPYHSDSTASRLLSEVKHCRARLVLRWGTTLESLVLFFCQWPFFS